MDSVGPYKILEKIGEGTYGVVYLGEAPQPVRTRRDGGTHADRDLVAMKKIRLDDHQEGVPVTTLREVALLQELRHDNIVRLREIIPCSPRLYLVFDYMDLDLKQCLDSRFSSGMPDRLIRSCMYQMLAGVDFCHAKLVLHRDLKPQNVLIDKQGRVKLADFGLARTFQSLQSYTHEVVTLWYRAPELLLGQQKYSASVDMWSVGCIMAELSSRRALFPGDSEIDQLFKIFRVLGTPDEASWPGVTSLPDYQSFFPRWAGAPVTQAAPRLSALAGDLLKKLVMYQPSRRLSAHGALMHPYFDDVRDVEHGGSLLSISDCAGDMSPTPTTAAGSVAGPSGADMPGAAAAQQNDEQTRQGQKVKRSSIDVGDVDSKRLALPKP